MRISLRARWPCELAVSNASGSKQVTTVSSWDTVLQITDGLVRRLFEIFHPDDILDPCSCRLPQYRSAEIIMNPRFERLEKTGFYISSSNEDDVNAGPAAGTSQRAESTATVGERCIAEKKKEVIFFRCVDASVTEPARNDLHPCDNAASVIARRSASLSERITTNGFMMLIIAHHSASFEKNPDQQICFIGSLYNLWENFLLGMSWRYDAAFSRCLWARLHLPEYIHGLGPEMAGLRATSSVRIGDIRIF